MKKLVVLFTSIYLVASSAASAFVLSSAAIASLGMGAVSGLMPLLQPLAEETILASVTHLKEVVTGATCPVTCRGPTGVPCMGPHILSSCKQICQKIENVGGYELRIRFGKDWSLIKCIRKGIKMGHQTSQGKGNPKSIAIYSQKDLDDLLSLIAVQMAARHTVQTKASGISDKTLAEQGTTREKMLQESAELVDHVEVSIKKNVEDGIYGNQ